jgi:hypothetical protein
MCRIILSSVACLAVPYFSTLSHKRHDFRKKVIEHKMCVLTFSTILSETLLILRRIQRDIIINIHRSSCTLPVILVRFEWNLNFLYTFCKNTQIPNVTKIHPVEAELFHADGQTDTTKITVDFRSFANVPKNTHCLLQHSHYSYKYTLWAKCNVL